MSKVLENKKKGFTVSLKIEADPDAVNASFDMAFKRLAKSASIPGFRKGKISRNMFEKNYGKQVIIDEAMSDIVNDAYRSAITELDLNVVDYPQNINIDDYDESTPIRFTCDVDVEPDVKLGKYKGIKVKRDSIDVSDDDVTAELDKLRENYADYKEVDTASKKDDILLCNITATSDGETIDVWTRDNAGVKLGMGHFGEDFDAAIEGAKKGDHRSFNVTYSDTFTTTEVAGKTIDFSVDIVDVREKTLPDLDDEFAKKASKSDTLDDLKKQTLETLKKDKKQQSDDKLKSNILDSIMNDMKVDIPQGMVQRQIDNEIRQMEDQMARSGLQMSQYLQAVGKDIESIRDELKPTAERRVKLELAIEAVAQKEKIEPKDTDLEAEIKTLNLPDITSLEEYKASHGENLDFFKEHVKRQMTFDYLVEHAKIS